MSLIGESLLVMNATTSKAMRRAPARDLIARCLQAAAEKPSSTCRPSATRAGWWSPTGAPFRFPTLHRIDQVLDRKHVVIVNDNNYPATGGRGGVNVRTRPNGSGRIANPL
jgi:hypothetical protein